MDNKVEEPTNLNNMLKRMFNVDFGRWKERWVRFRILRRT